MLHTQAEVDRNRQALLPKLPSLLPEHRGRCALMRHGDIVAILDSAREALHLGRQLYGPAGEFSVQPIVKPSQLAIFSGF
jgi:hypothetical protein